MTNKHIVKYLAIGLIQNEFIIDLNGRAANNILGGPLLYAAACMNHLGGLVGMIGNGGANFPAYWKKMLDRKGLDSRGIKDFPKEEDFRFFSAFSNKMEIVHDNPVAQYSSKGLPFPRELLGYVYGDAEKRLKKLQDISLAMISHIPADYMDALAVHISPLDITCQIQLSTIFKKGSIQTICIQPHSAYMNPSHWEDFPVLVKDSTMIMTREAELSSLFLGRSADTWEMMEQVAGFGCQFVITKIDSKGHYLYDSTNKSKHFIPRYPSKIVNPSGDVDAFCAGFLVGFQSDYNPLEAVIQGSALSSFVSEHVGPFAIDQSLPDLQQARMDWIRSMTVQK